jgi:hypothetical protein
MALGERGVVVSDMAADVSGVDEVRMLGVDRFAARLYLRAKRN